MGRTYVEKCPYYPYLEFVHIEQEGWLGESTAIWYNNNPIISMHDFEAVRNRFISGKQTIDGFEDYTSAKDRKILSWLDKRAKKVKDWF